jgi:hypothetical protein
MIVHEELGRWKVRGFDDGVIGGMVISAPTVLNFGSPALKQKVNKSISIHLLYKTVYIYIDIYL